MKGRPARYSAVAATALLLFAASMGVVASTSQTTQSSDMNVTLVAHYPTNDGYENETLLGSADLASVGEPEPGRVGGGSYHVPVTLTDEGAERFTGTLTEHGFTTTGAGDCDWEGSPEDPGYCLLTVIDGEVTAWHALGPSLADAIEEGTFEEDPRFVFTARNETTAEQIATSLGEEVGRNTTETARSVDGEDGEGSSPGEDSTTGESGGGAIPGFGVAAALLALFVATLAGRT